MWVAEFRDKLGNVIMRARKSQNKRSVWTQAQYIAYLDRKIKHFGAHSYTITRSGTITPRDHLIV